MNNHLFKKFNYLTMLAIVSFSLFSPMTFAKALKPLTIPTIPSSPDFNTPPPNVQLQKPSYSSPYSKYNYKTPQTGKWPVLHNPNSATPNPAPPTKKQQSLNQMKSFDLNQLSTKGQKNIKAISTSAKTNGNPIADFIIHLINLIILIAGSVSFLGVIIGGFFILSNAGSENRLNKGKEIITYAITGLIITLSAYFIVAFVQGIIFAG